LTIVAHQCSKIIVSQTTDTTIM